MASAIERLGAAIEGALDEADVSDVLSVLTGAFVGITVELVRRQGHDVSKQIMVDGGKNRDITIHAEKAIPFTADAPPAAGPRVNPADGMSREP